MFDRGVMTKGSTLACVEIKCKKDKVQMRAKLCLASMQNCYHRFGGPVGDAISLPIAESKQIWWKESEIRLKNILKCPKLNRFS